MRRLARQEECEVALDARAGACNPRSAASRAARDPLPQDPRRTGRRADRGRVRALSAARNGLRKPHEPWPVNPQLLLTSSRDQNREPIPRCQRRDARETPPTAPSPRRSRASPARRPTPRRNASPSTSAHTSTGSVGPLVSAARDGNTLADLEQAQPGRAVAQVVRGHAREPGDDGGTVKPRLGARRVAHGDESGLAGCARAARSSPAAPDRRARRSGTR